MNYGNKRILRLLNNSSEEKEIFIFSTVTRYVFALRFRQSHTCCSVLPCWNCHADREYMAREMGNR